MTKTRQIRNQIITTLLKELEDENMINQIKFKSIANVYKNDYYDALQVMILLFAITQELL